MNGGDEVFENDPSIEDPDPVWRRVRVDMCTYDHNAGVVRPTSQCFQYSQDRATGKKHPMSVALGKDITPEQALEGHPPELKLVGWTAGHVRSLNLGVCPDPQPEAVAHGLVFTLETDATGKQKTKLSDPVRKALTTSAKWVMPLTPEQVEVVRQRTTAT